MDQKEQLAWVVLRAANRTQAKGSTVRLIVPRAPEVAEELGIDLTDAQYLSVEEYLLDHGHLAPADIGLTWGTYTLTPAGLRWLEVGLPEPSPADDRLRELADDPDEGAAFESAIRAELEEEHRRMEAFERELDEAHRLSESAGPRPATGGPREESAEHPWWRFWGR